jgi:hypothetical protein
LTVVVVRRANGSLVLVIFVLVRPSSVDRPSLDLDSSEVD